MRCYRCKRSTALAIACARCNQSTCVDCGDGICFGCRVFGRPTALAATVVVFPPGMVEPRKRSPFPVKIGV